MRTCRRRNPFGVMMQYIVVCKDHFTGVKAAACIPRKKTTYVAFVLTEIFGQVGFPFILHPDNGKEFTERHSSILSGRILLFFHFNSYHLHKRTRWHFKLGTIPCINRTLFNSKFLKHGTQQLLRNINALSFGPISLT
jgi:hypothetical protein